MGLEEEMCQWELLVWQGEALGVVAVAVELVEVAIVAGLEGQQALGAVAGRA